MAVLTAAVHVRLIMILFAVQTVRGCRCECWYVCRRHRVAHTLGAAQASAVVADEARSTATTTVTVTATINIGLTPALHAIETVRGSR